MLVSEVVSYCELGLYEEIASRDRWLLGTVVHGHDSYCACAQLPPNVVPGGSCETSSHTLGTKGSVLRQQYLEGIVK